MGKKITKAVKKVVKEVTRPVEKVAKEITRPIKQVAGALAGAPDVPDTPAIVQQTPPAALVEVPQQEEVQTDTDATTESNRKKARAGGKKSLSVARSAGTGINI